MVLGVTGAIGGGKSFAIKAFEELGAMVVDCDKLCHRYYESVDSKLAKILIQRWGETIVKNSSIDRKIVGEIVFNDSVELKFLTSEVYPILEAEVTEIISSTDSDKLLVIELPLLFEYNWQEKLDATVTLWTERELRHKRLQNRGLSSEEIALRESKQFSAEKKLELADYAIVNNGSIDVLRIQCKLIIEKIMKGC